MALTELPEVDAPTAAEPITVVPSKKFTVPVGAAFDCVPVTVAVSTVLDPARTGEDDTASEVVDEVEYGETFTVTLPNEYAA